MNITLQLFGAFRGLGDELVLQLPENSDIAKLREALKNIIQNQPKHTGIFSLLGSTRFATKQTLLVETSSLQDGDIVAVIPPVSGG